MTKRTWIFILAILIILPAVLLVEEIAQKIRYGKYGTAAIPPRWE